MSSLLRAGLACFAGIALTFLGACAQQPAIDSVAKDALEQSKAAPEPVTAAEPEEELEAAVDSLEDDVPESQLVLPKQKLSNDILYGFLVAELAAQRENYPLAARTYVELARRTKDPRVARRAVDMAFAARIPDVAIDATRIWMQTEPESDEAARRLVGLLISTNRVDEARPHLQRLLTSKNVNTGAGFLQLNRLLSGNPDRAENLRVVQELAQPYPELPEAHIAVAQAALHAGQNDLARSAVATANKLRPDWELGALLETQVIQRMEGNEAAQAHLENYLRTHPQSKDMRLNYARLLTAEKKYPQAREQFEQVLKDNTADPDVVLSAAALAAQMKDFDAAERHFKRYLELETRNAGLARFNLGQIAEDRLRYDEALEWYRGIKPNSEQYLGAQFRQAHIQAKQGDVEGARKYLQQITPMSNQQRIQLIMAEVALLNEAGRAKEAFDLLSDALEKLPNDSELLYQQSMQAEKVGRFDVLESSLRKLIRIKPDHAHAYNALGYSLADRNERLSEAHELIRKAVALAPDDFYIMDSMGWVLFRQGKNDEAITWLRRAYNGRGDAEIAAHLGEVLWVAGQRDEARKLWADALDKTPGNDVLLKTVQRLQQP